MNEIIKKNGITYGIILGVFSILVTTVIYAVDLELFLSMWLGIAIMAIYIAIGVMLVSKTKKQLNNVITFKEAFTVYFIAAVIGTTLSIIFNIILFNYIDPEAKATIQQLTMEYMVQTLEKFGTPAAQVNETIEKMGQTDNYSPANQLMGLAISIVIQAVFGLILALIFKTKTDYKD